MPAGAGGMLRVDVSQWMAQAGRVGVAARLIQPVATESARIAARRLQKRAQTEVMATPMSGGGGPHSGLRGRIRGGIETHEIPRGAEIVSTAFLATQYNNPAWRHPVYGHDVWVTQLGMPYWTDTMDNAEGMVGPSFIATVIAAVDRML